jgi:hypothetical protein
MTVHVAVVLPAGIVRDPGQIPVGLRNESDPDVGIA